MRIRLIPATALCLLLFLDRLAAQQWSVDLYDVTLEDPSADRVEAESVEFMPDGKKLVTAGYFYDGKSRKAIGEIRLRSTIDGSLTARLRGKAKTYSLRAGSLAISPSGKWIAAAGRNGANRSIVDVFDGAAMKRIHTLRADRPAVTCLAFSPDGKVLAAAHMNGAIELWNHQTGKKTAQFVAHVDGAWPIMFSPDGRLLASANQDTTVRIWDVYMDNHFRPIRAHRDFVYDVAFSPDGTSLATLGRDSLKLWRIHQLRTRE